MEEDTRDITVIEDPELVYLSGSSSTTMANIDLKEL